MLSRRLYDVIVRIIINETIFLRHYIGQVKDINDPFKEGRVKVSILELGIETQEAAFWCVPRDKNSLSIPKLNDWVEVYFLNGDRNKPVYMGIANEMQGMRPKNFDGNTKTHILFESPENLIHLKYSELNNLLEIGNSDFKEAARKEDATLSNTTTDNAFFNFLSQLHTAINAWTPVPNDGGAALKTALATWLALTPPSKLDGKINEGSDQVKIGNK